MNRLKLALVSCGFLGCAPVAPGTFGTLGGVAIAWALSGTGELFPLWVLATCALLYALTGATSRSFGSGALMFGVVLAVTALTWFVGRRVG